MIVGAARGGARLGVGTAGFADVQAAVAADASVAYRIGSITKTFTAALVLSLVEEGVLALDAPVGRYLPGTVMAEVPLRMLLAHRGGVQREVPGQMWETMQGPDSEQLLAALGKAEFIDRPGARWHYSNLGYAVLGQVVTRTAAVPCQELITSRFCEPLGLAATSWSRPRAAAVGYRVEPHSDLVHPEPDMDQGEVGVGGQLWSTIGDLLVWGDTLAGGSPHVVSPLVVAAMHTVQVMVDLSGWRRAWGLGLILDRRGERVTAGHTGAMPGFQSAMSFDRDTRSVAVVLSNATRGGEVGRLATDLVHETIQLAPLAAEQPWAPTLTPVPAELDGVLGRWWSEADETMFTWRDNALHACLLAAPAGEETRFERTAPDAFRAVAGRLTGERLHVRRDSHGAVTGLTWATYPFTRRPR